MEKKLISLIIIILSIISCTPEGETWSKSESKLVLDPKYIIPNDMVGSYINIQNELNTGTIEISKELLVIKTNYYTQNIIVKDYVTPVTNSCFIMIPLSFDKKLYIQNGIKFNKPCHMYIEENNIIYNLGYFNKI